MKISYKDKLIFGSINLKGVICLNNNDVSYITIRIYIYMLIAYLRGSVEVKEKYKNFDLLLNSKFMEHESIEHEIITDSSPGFLFVKTERKPQEKVTFYLTVEGKKMFIKINWILVTAIFTFVGFIFGVVKFVLPFFLVATTIFGCWCFDF